MVCDVTKLLASSKPSEKVWAKKASVVVNTTASLRVRAALNYHSKHLCARVIETILYGSGRIGLIATEGDGHNPSIGDLFSCFYEYCKSDHLLRKIMFGENDVELERATIGQGCGSATMRMSDGRVSIFSAAAAEYLLTKQHNGLPNAGGEILVGMLDESGLGVTWRSIDVPPPMIVKCDNNREWSARIAEKACKKIKQEVLQCRNSETGGVLLGRHDEITKTFHVVDVLPAPPDSVRSSSEFVLMEEGLAQKIGDYSKEARNNLYCLGTWHSHLASSGASERDRDTAREIASTRAIPSVLLIHEPNGFRALLAEDELVYAKQVVAR